MVLVYPEHSVRYAAPEADFSAWVRSCGGFGAKVTESGDVAG